VHFRYSLIWPIFSQIKLGQVTQHFQMANLWGCANQTFCRPDDLVTQTGTSNHCLWILLLLTLVFSMLYIVLNLTTKSNTHIFNWQAWLPSNDQCDGNGAILLHYEGPSSSQLNFNLHNLLTLVMVKVQKNIFFKNSRISSC